MPTDYNLTIDGKSHVLHWDSQNPPSQADIEGIVSQYHAEPSIKAQKRQQAGQVTAPLAAAPALPAIDPAEADYRQKYLQPGDKSTPAILAESLARFPNHLRAGKAAQSGMSALGQRLVLQRAQELADEARGIPSMRGPLTNQPTPNIASRALAGAGSAMGYTMAPVKLGAYELSEKIADLTGDKPKLPGDVNEKKRLAKMNPLQRALALKDQGFRNLGRPDSEAYAQRRDTREPFAGRLLGKIGNTGLEVGLNPLTYAAAGLGSLAESPALVSRPLLGAAVRGANLGANTAFTVQQLQAAGQDLASGDLASSLVDVPFALLGAIGTGRGVTADKRARVHADVASLKANQAARPNPALEQFLADLENSPDTQASLAGQGPLLGIGGGDYYIPSSGRVALEGFANPTEQGQRLGNYKPGPQGQNERINAPGQRYRVSPTLPEATPETPSLFAPREKSASAETGLWPGQESLKAQIRAAREAVARAQQNAPVEPVQPPSVIDSRVGPQAVETPLDVLTGRDRRASQRPPILPEKTPNGPPVLLPSEGELFARREKSTLIDAQGRPIGEPGTGEIAGTQERPAGVSAKQWKRLQAQQATRNVRERVSDETGYGQGSGDRLGSGSAGSDSAVSSNVDNRGSGDLYGGALSDASRSQPDYADKRSGHLVGRADIVETPKGSEVGVHYAVVPMDELIPSQTDSFADHPRFDQTLQPRDRSKQASADQVADIAARLRPRQLGQAPSTTEGAPIIGSDNMVESGNARLLGLRRARAAHPENWTKYQESVLFTAENYGIDPEAIMDMLSKGKDPVLVRVRDSFNGKTELTPAEREAFAKEAGASSVSRMSAAETALVDSGNLLSKGFLKPDAQGRYPSPSSQSFRERFMTTVSEADRPTMIQKDGQLSVDGERRIRNAVLASAMDDPTALSRTLESPDDATRNMGKAVLENAPKLAAVKQGVADGTLYPLEISKEMSDAANRLAMLRNERIPVDQWLSTPEMFGKGVDPLTANLMRVMEAYKRSSTALARILDSYADGVFAAGNPKEGSLFGDVEPPTKGEVLDAAIRRAAGDAERELRQSDESGGSEGSRSGGNPAGSGGAGVRNPGTAKDSTAANVGDAAPKPGQAPAKGNISEASKANTQAEPLDAKGQAREFLRVRLSEAASIKSKAERGKALEGTAPPAIAEEFGISRAEARALVDEVQAELRKERFADTRERLDNAEKNIRQGMKPPKKGQGGSSNLPQLVAIGAIKIAKGFVTFAEWATEMQREYGRHLRGLNMADLWQQAQALHAQNFAPRENSASDSQTPAGANTPDSQGKVSVFKDGRFRASYAVDKTTGDLVNSLAAAQESSYLRGIQAERDLLGNLSGEQKDALGRLLVGRRLRQLNPQHPQAITVKTENAILQDKAVADAALRYAKEIKPEIESFRRQSGLTAEQAAKNADPLFISLLKQETDAGGNPVITNEAGERLTAPDGKSRGSLSSRTRSRSTVHAKKATGQAEEYVTDLGHILKEGFQEALPKARLRQVYEHLTEHGLAWTPDPKQPGARPPAEIAGHPAQAVEVSRYGMKDSQGNIIRDLYVPEPIARNLQDVLYKPAPSEVHEALRFVQGVATTTALSANPAELLNHMRRVSGALANIPPASIGARLSEAALPYIGPKVGAWMRIIGTDMSLAENKQILQDVFDANGGSSRAFSNYESKVPVLGKLQHASHQLLFGIPEGKGVKGFDLRVRVAAEKIRRAVEGNTDPKRIRDFSNQFGQYTSKPDQIVDIVKHVNPFAATNLPLRVTELKQYLLGDSGLRGGSLGVKGLRRAETLWRGLGGTALALVFLNKAMSGKYPWENDPGHTFEVNVGQDDDDKTVYVKPQAIDPLFSRVINTFGLPGVDAEREAEENKDYVSAVTTGLANQGLNIVSSPATNAIGTALTGKAAYLQRRPGQDVHLLDLAGKNTDEDGNPRRPRWLRSLEAAARGLNPIGAYIPGAEEQGAPMQNARYKNLERATRLLGHVVRKGK